MNIKIKDSPHAAAHARLGADEALAASVLAYPECRSFAVRFPWLTFGVAPLLFVQALWGQLFFPSSVLIAWWWLAVISQPPRAERTRRRAGSHAPTPYSRRHRRS